MLSQSAAPQKVLPWAATPLAPPSVSALG